jgi:hypothetical protein
MPVIGFAVGLYRGFGVGDLMAKPVNSITIGIVSGGGLGLGDGYTNLAPPIGVPT